MLDRCGISTVITCYNQGRFLNTAIESVLTQSASSEVIVIDDGSTDNTNEIARAFGSRIRYVAQENRGLCAARNRGIQVATKELVHFLDADDYLLPGIYEKTIASFTSRVDASCIYFGYRFVDVMGKLLREVPAPPESNDLFHDLLVRNSWPCHAVIVRNSELTRVGGFDTQLRACEDWDFWLRLAMEGGHFIPIATSGVCYRRYPNTMSSNFPLMMEYGMRVITENAIRHGFCPQCRNSLTKGFRALQGQYAPIVAQPASPAQPMPQRTGPMGADSRS